MQSKRVVLLYKRGAEPDTTLLNVLEQAFSPPEYEVFVDRHLKIGLDWARIIEEKIRRADAIIPLISEAAQQSEMLEYEVEIALDEMLRSGAVKLLPIRIGSDLPPGETLGLLLNNVQYAVWKGPADTSGVLATLVDALEQESDNFSEVTVTLAANSVPADTPFYVRRSTDEELAAALESRESIVLVKGPRQVGKTSLVGQGIRRERQRGIRCVTTDFQRLASAHLSDAEACYRVLAADLDRQLRFGYDFESEWLPMFGAGSNLHNFLRALVNADSSPITWFMDEADRLFATPFSEDFFALARSWHSVRMLEPEAGWERLSIVITYATEAHLFIQDLNQSPFNVGRQLTLRNFSLDQVSDLNERYGRPLRNVDQVQWLFEMVGGQPALTRKALDYVRKPEGSLRTLMQEATSNDGPFGDHLKRILVSVSQLQGVQGSMRDSLSNVVLRDSVDVQRLLAAGILTRKPDGHYAVRCKLYRQYLAMHL